MEKSMELRLGGNNRRRSEVVADMAGGTGTDFTWAAVLLEKSHAGREVSLH